MTIQKLTGILGLSAVSLFLASLVIFGSLHPDFDFLNDYVSKLGANGEPNALGWNLLGFVLVGLLSSAFGFLYGRILEDRLLSVLLSLFGLGFAFTAAPIDMEMNRAPFSKAHIVAICLGLAFWLFGLARMGSNQALPAKVKKRANIAATLLVLSIVGVFTGIWSEPVNHRLVFLVVFGWTFVTSWEMVKAEKGKMNTLD